MLFLSTSRHFGKQIQQPEVNHFVSHRAFSLSGWSVTTAGSPGKWSQVQACQSSRSIWIMLLVWWLSFRYFCKDQMILIDPFQLEIFYELLWFFACSHFRHRWSLRYDLRDKQRSHLSYGGHSQIPYITFCADPPVHPCSSGALERIWTLMSNELTLLLWHVHDQGPLQLFSSNLSLQLIETAPSVPLRKSCLLKYHQETTS